MSKNKKTILPSTISAPKKTAKIKSIAEKTDRYTIQITSKKKLKDALLVTGGPKQTSKIKKQIFSEYVEISNKSSNVRKFGSAALDMAFVACGRFDGYWQREINLWDVAAGVVIVKEAGGFIDFFEDDTKFPLKKNILATNSSIHDELKDLISKKVIE